LRRNVELILISSSIISSARVLSGLPAAGLMPIGGTPSPHGIFRRRLATFVAWWPMHICAAIMRPLFRVEFQ
jgi:hypothetical protein